CGQQHPAAYAAGSPGVAGASGDAKMNEPIPHDAVPPSRRFTVRRLLMIVLFIAAASLAGVLVWKQHHVESMPPPPEVALGGVDPAIRESIESARAKVLQEPRSAETWGLLGKLLRAPEFNDAAAVCFAQAEKLQPNNVRWPYLQGEAFVMERPEAALPYLRRAVEIGDQTEPDNLVPRLRLAEALMAVGMHDEAETCLRRAHE